MQKRQEKITNFRGQKSEKILFLTKKRKNLCKNIKTRQKGQKSEKIHFLTKKRKNLCKNIKTRQTYRLVK